MREHYTWGNNCDGWHLVKTPTLSIIEEQMPPSTSETRHHHTKSHQFFYVLEGELTIEIENEIVVLKTGEGIEIAAGQIHQAFNKSDQPIRFLVTSTPPSHGDRIET